MRVSQEHDVFNNGGEMRSVSTMYSIMGER